MKLKDLRIAVFENADRAVLEADVNKFLAGEAVATSATYPAGFVKEQTLVGVTVAGDRVLIAYTE